MVCSFSQWSIMEMNSPRITEVLCKKANIFGTMPLSDFMKARRKSICKRLYNLQFNSIINHSLQIDHENK